MVTKQDDVWFSGDGRTDHERDFLDHLRRDAVTWVNDVRPANTYTFTWEHGPLVLGVDIPGLTTAFRHLWVSYWTSEEPARRFLEGAWGDDHIADNYTGSRFEDLTVAGVLAEPAQFATWCSQWLSDQLNRPVVREEWGSADQAAVWKLVDTDRTLQTRGPFWVCHPPTAAPASSGGSECRTGTA